MADVEEPQFSTLAERIAALNKQKNFSSTAPAPAPAPRPLVRSATTASAASAASAVSSAAPAASPGVRRPPPPPPAKPAAINTPTNPSPAPSPTTAVAATKPKPTPPLVPIRSATVRTTGSGYAASGNATGGSPLAKPPPPKLPPRQPSTLQKPQLPFARQPSADSVVSQQSATSAVSRVSSATSQSHGSASKRDTAGGDAPSQRKLPPAFGTTTLPALPPSRREREAREAREREAAEEEAAAREAAERDADERDGPRWDDRRPELPTRPGSLSRRESHASQRSDWAGDDGGRPSLPPRQPSRPSARPSYPDSNDGNYNYDNYNNYEERSSTSSRLSSAKSALGSGFSWGKSQIKKRTGGGGGGGDDEQAPNLPRRPTISEDRDDYGRNGYGRGSNGGYDGGGYGDGNRNDSRNDHYGSGGRNGNGHDSYGDGARNRSRNDSYGEGNGNGNGNGRNGGRNDGYGDDRRNDRRNDDRRDHYGGDGDDDDDRPPPLPMASRPSRAQVDAVVHGNDRPPPQPPRPGARGGPSVSGGRGGGNGPRDDKGQCLKCRDFSAADAVAAQFPLSRLPHDGTVVYLAYNLCDGFASATDKARAIFTWCHHNLAYDVDGFFGGRMPQGQTMEERIFSGKAVCDGYARVYEAIAEAAGLECVVVTGHGKGFGFRAVRPGDPVPRADPTGHAWNAVRIDGGVWKLVDPCWGAGNVSDQRRYEKRFKPAMFTMDNEAFGERHFPADPRYFFRADGRALSWREYIVDKEAADPVILFSNMPEQFLAEDAVEPRAGVIAAAGAGAGARPDDTVAFRFGRVCRHWTEERDGRNLAPYPMMLQVLAADGSRDGPMFDVHYDRPLLFWADVPRRSLGRPGDQLFCYAVTKMDGRDMRGATMDDFKARFGRCSYAIEGVCAWKIV